MDSKFYFNEIAATWSASFKSLYDKFSMKGSYTPFIFRTCDERIMNIELELNNDQDLVSACEENASLASYYKMWTDIFQLRWTIPLPDKGWIEISLKLPHFGFPPYAFVDSKNDPIVHELKSATWYEVYISETLSSNHGYGYIVDDVLQATALQRYLFIEDEQGEK